MRIAIINWSNRSTGGIETYLQGIIKGLVGNGHDVSFWYEVDSPVERVRIELPLSTLSRCIADPGLEKSLNELDSWRPDVIFAHKINHLELESQLFKIAPAVYFAHDHQGMCISGSRTLKFPNQTICNRRFGWPCLAHYLPRQCGGSSPLTMVRLFRSQSAHLDLMRCYDAIVTHSDYMVAELVEHGLSRRKIHKIPLFTETGSRSSDHQALSIDPPSITNGNLSKSSIRLLFSGRMEQLKGGQILLDALPEVQTALSRTVKLVFAGDGSERSLWEQRAQRLRKNPNIKIEFTGWVNRARIDSLLDDSDLMVMPGTWPEPFGLSGPEAGLRGVPSVAFDVGGIPSWLQDGVNGCLAPADPPTAGGLAKAIIRCISDEETHAKLRRGAAQVSGALKLETHLASLLSVFASVVSNAGH